MTMIALVLCAVMGMAVGQGSMPCCTPDVWEGELHVYTGYSKGHGPLTVNVHRRILYDYQEKKEGFYLTEMFEDGTSTTVRFLVDYTAKKAWFIQENTCKSMNITRAMDKFCVPSDSHYYGDIFYGSGTHTLTAHRYYNRIVSRDSHDIGARYFTMSKDACVPIEVAGYAERHPGRTGSKIDYARGGTYVNIVPTINDREDLVPPPTCSMAEPATQEDIARFESLDGWSMFTREF